MIFLREISIGGKMRPIKMGFNTIARFGDLTGRTLAQIDTMNETTMTVSDTIRLCWCALHEGARYAKTDFITDAGEPVTVDDVGDWIDDNEMALVEIMMEFSRARMGADPAPGAMTGQKKSKPPNPKTRH
jgi:hypothetical protein